MSTPPLESLKSLCFLRVKETSSPPALVNVALTTSVSIIWCSSAAGIGIISAVGLLPEDIGMIDGSAFAGDAELGSC